MTFCGGCARVGACAQEEERGGGGGEGSVGGRDGWKAVLFCGEIGGDFRLRFASRQQVATWLERPRTDLTDHRLPSSSSASRRYRSSNAKHCPSRWSPRLGLFVPLIVLPSTPQSPRTPFPHAQTQSRPLRHVERSYLAHHPLLRPSTTPLAPCPSQSCTYSPSSGPPPQPVMAFFPLSQSQPRFYYRRRPPTRHSPPLVTPTASRPYSIKPVLPASPSSHRPYRYHHFTTFLHFTISHRLITSPPCRARESTSAIPSTTRSSRTTPSRSATPLNGAIRPTAVRPTAVRPTTVRPFRY